VTKHPVPEKVRRERRSLWDFVPVAFWAGYGAFLVWEAWRRDAEADPSLQLTTFIMNGLRDHWLSFALGAAAIVAIYVLSKSDRLLRRWERPRSPGPIGPLLLLKGYPVHTAICAVLLAVTAWGMFNHVGLAMVGIAATGWAFVSLARRLGLDPSNDPAISQNQGKV
jgi:hypothetical protein